MTTIQIMMMVMMISIIMVMMARRSRKKRGVRESEISWSALPNRHSKLVIIIIIIITMIVITTIRGPRLVDQSAERGSKRCREMRRTKIWASVRLSPFLAHLSMLSFIVSGCQTEGKNFGSFVQTTRDPIIWRATIFSHSRGPSSLSWLSSSRLSKHLKPGCFCVFVCVVCLFVCVFVSWLLVQCQPGEQTSISRCTAHVPSKRTKTSIARCLFSSFYFFELRFQDNNKEDEDVARAAELNQRCWSM